MKPQKKNLSREEKLALIDALEEKRRRLKLKRNLYSPNELQKKVHSCDKRIRFVAAANGVGKTTMGTWEAYWTATGTHPHRPNMTVPNKGIVLLDSPDKVERWTEEFRKWHDTTDWKFLKHGKPYITEIIIPNGSSIVFMFHLMEDLAFESIELDYLIADEPPPRKPYVGLQRGMRRISGAWTLIVGTPLAQPWLKTELWDKWANNERDDIECFKAGMRVNQANLGKDYIDNFAKDLTEHEKKVRLDGDFAHLEGLALADLFKRDTHIIEDFAWPRNWPCVLAIDFHPAKPCTAVLLGANKFDQLVVLKEYKSKSPPSKFGQEIKDLIKGYRIDDIVCDSIGSTPKTGGYENKSFIQVLREPPLGLRIRPTTYKEKSEDAWVQNLRDLLPARETKMGKIPGLLIFQSCTGIVNEFESVMWARNRANEELKGKLDISNKDLLSCLKYALATPPMFGRISTIYRKPRPTTYGGRR